MSAGVVDGQAVSAGITNPAFVFKDGDDLSTGMKTWQGTAYTPANFVSVASTAVLPSTDSLLKVTGSTAMQVLGIVAPTKDKILVVHNKSTQNTTLKNEDAGATAANRLSLPTSSDVVILPLQSAILFYDVSATRWKLFALSSGSARSIFALANNVAAQNVTGLLLDGTINQHVMLAYGIIRVGTLTIVETGIFMAHFDGTNWMADKIAFFGDADTLLFITTGGQVQYTTGNQAGSASAFLRWKPINLEV